MPELPHAPDELLTLGASLCDGRQRSRVQAKHALAVQWPDRGTLRPPNYHQETHAIIDLTNAFHIGCPKSASRAAAPRGVSAQPNPFNPRFPAGAMVC